MKYEHLVYMAEKDGKPHIIVDRVEGNGRRHFCTHYELPTVQSEDEGFDLMEKVASWLGNTLLIDCPNFRRHIGIEKPDKNPK